ncbi:MAG: threonine synthase, partial [Woeseiaceae bacterium]
HVASLDEALLCGMATDGGLFVPESWPAMPVERFAAAESIQQVAGVFLSPFFSGSRLESSLGDIIEETFRFPIPLRPLPVQHGHVSLLELFHGPTAAFKDVGAAFLAACLGRLEGSTSRPLTILVATSGDTGGAVAAAFDGKPGMRVVVLFPEGRVSPRQQKQLTCWGDNVLSLAVEGSFDDCQGLVKSAMADTALSQEHRFSSANSINIGRLLPQCCYYAHAALTHQRRYGKSPSFVVPTGNLGNGLACILARASGLPISRIILACNANRLIADYLAGADWIARPSIATLASAMDVGNPSNMERLRSLIGDAGCLREQLDVVSADDDAIREQIRHFYKEFGIAVCPHTATASFAYDMLDSSAKEADDWILVSTAHAAKFENIVEPLVNETVAVPDALAAILSRPVRMEKIAPSLESLDKAIRSRFMS